MAKPACAGWPRTRRWRPRWHDRLQRRPSWRRRRSNSTKAASAAALQAHGRAAGFQATWRTCDILGHRRLRRAAAASVKGSLLQWARDAAVRDADLGLLGQDKL